MCSAILPARLKTGSPIVLSAETLQFWRTLKGGATRSWNSTLPRPPDFRHRWRRRLDSTLGSVVRISIPALAFERALRVGASSCDSEREHDRSSDQSRCGKDRAGVEHHSLGSESHLVRIQCVKGRMELNQFHNSLKCWTASSLVCSGVHT